MHLEQDSEESGLYVEAQALSRQGSASSRCLGGLEGRAVSFLAAKVCASLLGGLRRTWASKASKTGA